MVQLRSDKLPNAKFKETREEFNNITEYHQISDDRSNMLASFHLALLFYLFKKNFYLSKKVVVQKGICPKKHLSKTANAFALA